MSPKPTTATGPTLTAAQVRKRAHISERSLRRWNTAGLTPVKPGVYLARDVEAFLENKTSADSRHRRAQTELASGLADEAEGKLAQSEADHRDVEFARNLWDRLRVMVLGHLGRLPATLAAGLPSTAGEIAVALKAGVRAALTQLAHAVPEDAPESEVAAPRCGHTLEDQRARYASARAALARHRTKLAAGDVVPVAWMHLQFAGPVVAVRARLLAIPVTLAAPIERAIRAGGAAAAEPLLARAVRSAAAELPVEAPLHPFTAAHGPKRSVPMNENAQLTTPPTKERTATP